MSTSAHQVSTVPSEARRGSRVSPGLGLVTGAASHLVGVGNWTKDSEREAWALIAEASLHSRDRSCFVSYVVSGERDRETSQSLWSVFLLSDPLLSPGESLEETCSPRAHAAHLLRDAFSRWFFSFLQYALRNSFALWLFLILTTTICLF